MTREMYEGLFDGVKVRTVEMKLLEETYRQAVELAEANGWPPEEALLTIFAHGLAQLRADTAATGDDPDEDSPRNDLMRLDGMYSVMKFRAFTRTGENQRIRMALVAYQQEHGGLKRVIERLRAELEEAKRTRGAESPPAVEPAAVPAASPPRHAMSILRTLCSRLRGR